MLPVHLTLAERAWLAGTLRYLAGLPGVDADDHARAATITAKVLAGISTARVEGC